jgi:hypothetical protein
MTAAPTTVIIITLSSRLHTLSSLQPYRNHHSHVQAPSSTVVNPCIYDRLSLAFYPNVKCYVKTSVQLPAHVHGCEQFEAITSKHLHIAHASRHYASLSALAAAASTTGKTEAQVSMTPL